MKSYLWMGLLLLVLSLSNIIAFWFDPTTTKFAGIIVPVIFFLGVSRLFSVSRKTLLFIFIPFFCLSFVDLNYLFQFNMQTTPGMIEAIMQSDQREITEFMQVVSTAYLINLAFYIFIFMALFWSTRFIPRVSNHRQNKYLIVTILMIALPVADLLGEGASAKSFPLGIARAIYIYSSDQAKLNKVSEQRGKFSFGNITVSSKAKVENYILVMGESSRRDYYSLYGYQRQTNPELSKIKNLVVYEDVISPANTTILSLKSILYMATAEDDSLYYKSPSVVVLAKQAGYQTSWLSAQARYGKFDSATGATAVTADTSVFIDQTRSVKRTFDGDLLPYLNKSLMSSMANKFIVMHLYGSHFDYQRRYPETFDFFKNVPPGYENRTQGLQDKVNTYSNSIRYTDSFLSKVIERLSKTHEPGCMIYTADHGEYLGESGADDFTGHGYPSPYKVELEVPFLVWCNEEYRETYPHQWKVISSNKKEKISSEDLFYSLADLLHISFDLQKIERSFFNEAYEQPERRMIRTSADNKLFNYLDLK